jgi:ectoine hydroxylase-related dioxygenase (phytanoyl-CoA dioxygenase family)|tara:strand:- start:26 stop:568 length:543 start_codon:yes stop_codon:yes gene_type:complete
MIITDKIQSKISRKCFFIRGKIEIDHQYFIKNIKQTCKTNVNLNYKTNVRGFMTQWNHFAQDKNFLKIIRSFMKEVDKTILFPKYICSEAWGFEVPPNNETKFHSHQEALWSGAIYLSSSSQKLIFPEINKEIKPEIGSFVIFSGFLSHGCEANEDNVSKFGLSFNVFEQKPWCVSTLSK